MPPTLKDDFIAFFENLTHASPEHKKAVDKAVEKLKKSEIKNTLKGKADVAKTLFGFCTGMIGGVKPVLKDADWERIEGIAERHYPDTKPDLTPRHNKRR